MDPIQCIERGESLLLLGRPGTGKSTLTNQLVEILEGKGQHVICAAKTHVAASRLKNGISLNHFVNSKVKRGRYPAWLILDEISMIECSSVGNGFKVGILRYKIHSSGRLESIQGHK